MSRTILIATLAIAAAAWAQDFRGSIQGNVTDPSQGAIGNAAVTLRNSATGVERTATSDDNGFYIFQFLPPGAYSIAVKAAGFKSVTRQGMELAVSQSLREDIALQVGDTAETVNVVADVAVIDTDSTSLGTALRQEIRDNLPLKGRSSLFMFTLTPGVVNNRYGEDTRPNDTITNVLFSANGAPVAATDVFVDGTANTVNVNRGVNISQWVPAVDAIGEFKLEVGSVPAEYGRSGGSVTNMVIKSGTNRFHGSMYDFLRNSRLDANLFFNRGAGRTLPAFSANTFGVAVGGPVYFPKLFDGRNKTFWFASYEGAREGNGTSPTNTVPTAKMRQGDFSEVSSIIYDPYSVATVNGAPTRTPFAGNIIPPARQDPVGRAVMAFYPAPNRAPANPAQPWVQNFGFSAKWPRNYNTFVTKIDHVFSQKWTTFFRLNHGTALLIFPHEFDGIATPGRDIVKRPHEGFSWGNTVLISPRTTFDLRTGFAWGKEDREPFSTGFDVATLGFAPGFANLLQHRSFPIFSVQGFQQLSNSPKQLQPGYTWTFQPSLSHQRGKHVMKYGADVRLLYGHFLSLGVPSGRFNFNQAWSNGPRADTPLSTTGFPMASLILGLGSGQVDTAPAVSIVNNYYGFFVQDDYRITTKLTFNIGLRYEYETPRTERFDRATRGFDRSAQSPLRVPGLDLRGGLLYAGVNGQPRGINLPDRNNFAPRFGFAYSLAPKTVLRGGYAVHYIPIVGSVESSGFSTTSPQVTSTDGITPRDRLSNPFPQGLVPARGNQDGLATFVGQSVTFVEPNDATPFMHTWNLNVQREVWAKTLFQVGYIGSRGIRLTSEESIGNNIGENLNQVDPAFLSQGRALLDVVNNPFFGVLTSGPLSGRTVQRNQLLRPYAQFQNISRNRPTFGNSLYHSLQAKFEQRMWRGMSSLVSYTWSKNMSDLQPIQNFYNRRIERGPNAFDVPQRLTVTLSWDTPVGRGKALLRNASKPVDLALGGWTISMFDTFQSGFPLAVGVSQNTLFLAGAGGQRASVVGNPWEGISGSINSRLNRYFNTRAFAQPADFTFGNTAPRLGWLRNPGMNNWNLTLTKQFAINERFKLNLRASSFNLMNTPVFGGPATTFGVGNFGVVLSQANISRQSEVVMRLFF